MHVGDRLSAVQRCRAASHSLYRLSSPDGIKLCRGGRPWAPFSRYIVLLPPKPELQALSAAASNPLVVHPQEIVSYIKGSAEALDSPTGKLSLEQYLEVGRKRAPNFTADTRRQVFKIFLQYEREKTRLLRWDWTFSLDRSMG